MKIVKKTAVLQLMLAAALLVSVSMRVQGETMLSVHVPDVGQGLCTAAESDGHWILYDGGGAQSAAFVVSKLAAMGAEKLDLIIASHYDDDHIGGLIAALYAFPVGEVFLPGYEADTVSERMLMQAIEETGTSYRVPEVGTEVSFGGASLKVIGPPDYRAEMENDRCIAVKITGGDVSCLCCGDAQQEEEESILREGEDISCTLYIASHHGSGGSGTGAFLRAASPYAALISCGSENEFGHPAESALERLKEAGCRLWRTDRQGSIDLWTDGTYLYGDPAPCDDFTPGPLPKEEGSETREENLSKWRYVLNLYSHKFHRPGCDSLEKISVRNRAFTNRTRHEVISMGYDPCGICDP